MKNIHAFLLCLLLVPEIVKAEFVFSAPEDAAIQKISAQVLIEAYRSIGHTLSIKYLPNARSLYVADSGKLDGEVSRIKGLDKEFNNLVRIPVAINYVEAYAFSLAQDIKNFDWDNIWQQNLVCVNGVRFIMSHLQQLNIDCNYVTKVSQTFKMLQLKRADIAILPIINGIAAIKETHTTDISFIDHSLIKMDLYHYVHKKNKHIIPALHSALTKMQENGRIKIIRKIYIEENEWE